MVPSPNIGIYANGLFNDSTPPYQQQLSEMQAAGFTTLILWALHVHDNGEFFYNDSPFVQGGQMIYSTDPTKGVNPELPELLNLLRGAGHVQQVVFSIGPFASDFQAIMNNLPEASSNFKTLIHELSIDAIDFDYEGGNDDSLIVDLTMMMDDLGVGVTYCPYTDDDWWFGCLADVYQKADKQIVRWFNLQCYDGGEYNDPAQWVSDLKSYDRPLGIEDPGAFIVPGYWAKNTGPKASICPGEVTERLQGLRSAGISGGWIWNTGDVFANEGAGLCPSQDVSPAGYANAIAAGVG